MYDLCYLLFNLDLIQEFLKNFFHFLIRQKNKYIIVCAEITVYLFLSF